jgi:hypothetical protein
MKRSILLHSLIFIAFSSMAQNRAPSCWLKYQDHFTGDVIVNTIRVAEPSPMYTYYCALQWNAGAEGGGYCGIQEHPDGRNFIYSIWDSQISEDAVLPVYTHPGTTTESFGGEGTGLKSWNFEIGWETNQWYSFVSRAWDMDDGTLFGFWVYDPIYAVWHHLVTMRYPVSGIGFSSSTGSFIEDWFGNGFLTREVHHKQGWKRQSSDLSWLPFSSVDFERVSPDPGAANYIEKYDGGVVDEEYFFMKSGGAISPQTNISGTRLELESSGQHPDFEAGQIKNSNFVFNEDQITISWQPDEHLSPQFSYHIHIYDNPGRTGDPLISLESEEPHIREAIIDVSELITSLYYFDLFITDVFGQTSNVVQHLVKEVFHVSVSAHPEDGGQVAGGGDFEYGDIVSVVAEPAEGHEFGNWSEKGVLLTCPPYYTFTIENDRDLVAYFIRNIYTITLISNPDEGGNPAGAGDYPYGTEVVLAANPNEGYLFEYWEEDGEELSSEPEYAIDFDENRTITAKYKSDVSGIESISDKNPWIVFPNPCQDYVIISGLTGKIYKDILVTITNMTGQELIRSKYRNADHPIRIDMQDIPEGVYFVRISRADELGSVNFFKIVKL